MHSNSQIDSFISFFETSRTSGLFYGVRNNQFISLLDESTKLAEVRANFLTIFYQETRKISDEKVVFVLNFLYKNYFYSYPRLVVLTDVSEMIDVINSIKAICKHYFENTFTTITIQSHKESSLFFCPFCTKAENFNFRCNCIQSIIAESDLTKLTELALKLLEETDCVINLFVEPNEGGFSLRDLNSCVAKKKKNEPLHITSLIEDFSSEEDLKGGFECNSCKTVNKGYKRIEISRFPKLLVICLKRFNFEVGNLERANDIVNEKNETEIIFPTEGLKISKLNSKHQEIIYDLLGVCNHEGTLQKGHYAAVVRHEQSWALLEDKNVQKIAAMLPSASNYLLFFEKREEKVSSSE